jgi:hypothetical protein
LEVVSSKLNKWTSNLVPVWNPYIPKVSEVEAAAAAAFAPHAEPHCHAGAAAGISTVIRTSFLSLLHQLQLFYIMLYGAWL